MALFSCNISIFSVVKEKPNYKKMRLTLFLLLSIICINCHKKERCDYLTHDYTFSSSSKIDTSSVSLYTDATTLIARAVPGEKLVFSYQSTHVDCPGIIDGGGGSLLLFEIDPSLTSFNYDSENLTGIKCYYRPFGALIAISAYTPHGRLKGKKINSKKWDIEGDFILDTGEHLQFSHTFTEE